MGKTIFVVEDERNIQELIQVNLEEYGYHVEIFQTGEDVIEASSKRSPDLFLLDIMLPGMDGLAVCRMIRQTPFLQNIPIIMLTAKSEEFDKILGLELGADDYITKPFSIRELLTRIKVVFRRINTPNETEPATISFSNISINLQEREVYKDGKLVDLTFKEFELLKILLENKKKILTREVILESVWGMDYFGETRTVDVHIRYLRQKLEKDDKNPEWIETIRGLGYRFNPKGVTHHDGAS